MFVYVFKRINMEKKKKKKKNVFSKLVLCDKPTLLCYNPWHAE